MIALVGTAALTVSLVLVVVHHGSFGDGDFTTYAVLSTMTGKYGCAVTTKVRRVKEVLWVVMTSSFSQRCCL